MSKISITLILLNAIILFMSYFTNILSKFRLKNSLPLYFKLNSEERKEISRMGSGLEVPILSIVTAVILIFNFFNLNLLFNDIPTLISLVFLIPIFIFAILSFATCLLRLIVVTRFDNNALNKFLVEANLLSNDREIEQSKELLREIKKLDTDNLPMKLIEDILEFCLMIRLDNKETSDIYNRLLGQLKREATT